MEQDIVKDVEYVLSWLGDECDTYIGVPEGTVYTFTMGDLVYEDSDILIYEDASLVCEKHMFRFNMVLENHEYPLYGRKGIYNARVYY